MVAPATEAPTPRDGVGTAPTTTVLNILRSCVSTVPVFNYSAVAIERRRYISYNGINCITRSLHDAQVQEKAHKEKKIFQS